MEKESLVVRKPDSNENLLKLNFLTVTGKSRRKEVMTFVT
jgi:hypothetical protein